MKRILFNSKNVMATVLLATAFSCAYASPTPSNDLSLTLNSNQSDITSGIINPGQTGGWPFLPLSLGAGATLTQPLPNFYTTCATTLTPTPSTLGCWMTDTDANQKTNWISIDAVDSNDGVDIIVFYIPLEHALPTTAPLAVSYNGSVCAQPASSPFWIWDCSNAQNNSNQLTISFL